MCATNTPESEGHHSISGQAMIEYIIVLVLAVIILISITGTSGNSPIGELATAIKNYWQNYSYIMSLP